MQAITVSQVNGYIRNIFDAEELLHNIPVIGEVFGVSTSQSITYFSLKDENSVLSCVCFYPQIAKGIVEGDKIVATGSVNYYLKGGRISFNVTRVEKQGQGQLFEEFLKLKEKLEKEGLFAENHKISMPEEIKRIGVITSKDGAVIQDIKNVAWRRNPSVDIVLYPTKVQGKDAEIQIANAIEAMDKYADVDVIVVARGGGSLEDLWAYNTEVVARATYACNKPIVSAVGHETDFTIIDFTADLRAPTPSAAAELLTRDIKETRVRAQSLVKRFLSSANSYLREKQNAVENTLNEGLHLIERRYLLEKEKFGLLVTKFNQSATGYIAQNEYSLGLNSTKLEKLNPLTILKQGYAKVEQDALVTSIKQVDKTKPLSIIFHDGKVKAKVEEE